MSLDEYIADAERMRAEARDQGYHGAAEVWAEVAKALRGVRDGGTWQDWTGVAEAIRPRPAPPPRWQMTPPGAPGWYWIRHIIAGKHVYNIAQHSGRSWHIGSRKLDDLRFYSFWPVPLQPPEGH